MSLLNPNKKFHTFYGPVHSWRLGSSLGIDLLGGNRKMCNFNCVYCQVGPTDLYTTKRHTFVPTESIIEEWTTLPSMKIDHLTFSGTGEPTLALNLGEVIEALKSMTCIPLAVITNSSLLGDLDVKNDLMRADKVFAKLDVANRKMFRKYSRAHGSLSFDSYLDGILSFRHRYPGYFALQVMISESNLEEINKLPALIRKIYPDEVQVNTPLRFSIEKPVSQETLRAFCQKLDHPNVRNVFDAEKKVIEPIDKKALAKRRPVLT